MLHLQITMTHKLLKLLKSERAIALHGCKGEDSVAYLGGNDQQLIDILSDALSDVGIKVQEAPNTMAGKQDENIINLTKNNAGVQIELTSSLRKELFVNNKSSRKSREDRDNWGDLMYDFADATIKSTTTSLVFSVYLLYEC